MDFLLVIMYVSLYLTLYFFDCIPYVSYFSCDICDTDGWRGLQGKNNIR
jgi:hypothetical protein